MKQITQSLKDGTFVLEDVPMPKVREGYVLVETSCSLISAGTERMLLDFGRGGWISKARQQPDKVKQVVEKIKTDGLLPTLESVSSKLDQPIPMGYCNVGRVLEVGHGVEGLKPGDRVVSNGHHAEIVLVPKHLVSKIPDEVSDEEAVFTILGAIGLQGIRLLNPTLGETFAVFGLGLIGLLAVQILKANGARVIGYDFDGDRVQLAKEFGAEAVDLSSGVEPVLHSQERTEYLGVDGVLVTASTKSDELMHQAAQMCRKRGRIILTGVTGLALQRADFYEKELTFQVSCSYGPGRYDSEYEEGGQDYPVAFVRWTEQRNFAAILQLMQDKKIQTGVLLSKKVDFKNASDAYDLIKQRGVIGVLLNYSEGSFEKNGPKYSRAIAYSSPREGQSPAIAFIGAGGFTTQKILPALSKTKSRLKWICSSGGISAAIAARKFGVEQSTTEAERIFSDSEVNAVFVTTRHDSHANYVIKALDAGKSVFVEKPLCIVPEDLSKIENAYVKAGACRKNARPIVMVGFNRRFSPLAQLLKKNLSKSSRPLSLSVTCNAGSIPPDHWIQDPKVGGGRIIGEACHFIDLMSFLNNDSPIVEVAATELTSGMAEGYGDTVSVVLKFANGSIGHLNYFSNGAKSFPKERIEVFGESQVFQIDNFRSLKGYGRTKLKGRSWRQDKGHSDEIAAFVQSLTIGGESPIPFQSLLNTTKATFAIIRSIQEQRTVCVEQSLATV